jgi:hypothetical protein
MKRLAVLFFLIFLAYAPIRAATETPETRVAVVIASPSGVQMYCVTSPEVEITGLDALTLTGVDTNIQRGALGASVCRIESRGCSAPTEPCFCQCQGSRCDYWSYYFQDEQGAWQYSGVGATQRRIRSGAVEGWLWNEGANLTPVGGLPDITFDEICNAPSDPTPPAQTQQGSDNISGGDAGNSIGVALFLGLVFALVMVVVWQRTRKPA